MIPTGMIVISANIDGIEYSKLNSVTFTWCIRCNYFCKDCG